MFTTMRPLLEDARKNHYAVPGFDVSNYEMIRAVIDVCEEMRSPALFMCLKPDLEQGGIHFLTAMLKEAEKHYTVPICIHLDHAGSFEEIEEAISLGFTSVMYDGSQLPFSENAENTRKVVEYAHAHGVSVEAELGHVGQGAQYTQDRDIGLTNVDEAVEYIQRTQVDALAVPVGTAHGRYMATPKLDFDRLAQLKKICTVPLVLHGGSSSGDENLKKAVETGITKVNIGTDLRMAGAKAVTEYLQGCDYPDYVQMINHGAVGYKEMIQHYMVLFGCDHKDQ